MAFEFCAYVVTYNKSLNVNIPRLQRMRFYERPARLNVTAHKRREDLVC